MDTTSTRSACLLGHLWCCALLAWGILGCEIDECSRGERYCDGNVAMRCDSVSSGDEHDVWKKEQCERCVEDDEGVFCAAQDEALDASCPSEGLETCHDNAVLKCSRTYATTFRPCPAGTSCFTREACVDGSSCAVTWTEAYCAFGVEPEPRCDQASGFCIDDTHVECRLGLVADATTCGKCVRGDGTPCESHCEEWQDSSDGYARAGCRALVE